MPRPSRVSKKHRSNGVGGGALDAPAVKRWSFSRFSANTEHIQRAVEGAGPYKKIFDSLKAAEFPPPLVVQAGSR